MSPASHCHHLAQPYGSAVFSSHTYAYPYGFGLLPAPLRSPIGPTSPNVFNSPVPSLSYTSPTIIEPGVESHEIQKRARLGGIGSYENYDEQEPPDQPLLIAEPTKTVEVPTITLTPPKKRRPRKREMPDLVRLPEPSPSSAIASPQPSVHTPKITVHTPSIPGGSPSTERPFFSFSADANCTTNTTNDSKSQSDTTITCTVASSNQKRLKNLQLAI